jgi:hypothetical protein
MTAFEQSTISGSIADHSSVVMERLFLNTLPSITRAPSSARPLRHKTLILIPLCLSICSIGCLYAPADPGERRSGVDAVGPANSGSAIVVGITTRTQVTTLLAPARQFRQSRH